MVENVSHFDETLLRRIGHPSYISVYAVYSPLRNRLRFAFGTSIISLSISLVSLMNDHIVASEDLIIGPDPLLNRYQHLTDQALHDHL